MIWMSDVDKQVTYVNQPWLTFTGWPSDVVPGHRWIELIHSDDVERCGDVYVKAFDRREPFQVDHRLRRHDGEYRWIVTVGVPRYDTDGSFTGYVGTAADITERKLAEELLSTFSQRLIEAQEEERAHLARELHDDINQRLALLGVRLDHLNRGSVSPDELGQEIGKASQEVAKLAKDVQALSYRLHSSKLEVLGLAAGAAGLCRELSDGKAVEIDFHADSVPHHVPWRVSLCLFRVLQEALQNAIKHSGSRHFQVLLQGGVNEIDLTVRDSGIGFDSAETTTGRGLGLTSMKERLKLIDGHLSIDSKPGCGTTIRACAPVARNMKSPETGV
jgi:PAS domain S-box-containing protein